MASIIDSTDRFLASRSQPTREAPPYERGELGRIFQLSSASRTHASMPASDYTLSTQAVLDTLLGGQIVLLSTDYEHGNREADNLALLAYQSGSPILMTMMEDDRLTSIQIPSFKYWEFIDNPLENPGFYSLDEHVMGPGCISRFDYKLGDDRLFFGAQIPAYLREIGQEHLIPEIKQILSVRHERLKRTIVENYHGSLTLL